MDIILLSVNNPNASNMTFFRFTPKNNNGVTGADAATTSAKILTVQPACGTETSKVSAIRGRIPTTPHFGIYNTKHTDREDKYEQTARMKF